MREIEMVCGQCGAFLNAADDESNIAILNLAYRFANAHVGCGYVTPGMPPEDEIRSSGKQEPLEK